MVEHFNLLEAVLLRLLYSDEDIFYLRKHGFKTNWFLINFMNRVKSCLPEYIENKIVQIIISNFIFYQQTDASA